MQSIFACKLYRASTRKQNILAAMNDPMNVELVQQLSTYLDEEYVPLTKDLKDAPKLEPQNEDSVEDSATENSAESYEGGGSSSHNSPSGGGSGWPSSIPSATPEEASGSEEAGGEAGEPSEEPSADNPPADEGDVESSTIVSQTVLNTSTSTPNLEAILSPASVKGMLNAKEETCGVNRILVKDAEMWIYYDDKKNLNDVMGDAIELLAAASYNSLNFNRLARSDNAIVFEILTVTTPEESRSVEEVIEEDGKE